MVDSIIMDNQMQPVQLGDIVVHDSLPTQEEVIEVHDPESHVHEHNDDHIHFDDASIAQPFEVEVITPYQGITVEDADQVSGIPEGADVVVSKNDEPLLAIDLGDLPGAPAGTQDPEMEEESEEIIVEDVEDDNNKASESSKSTSSKQDKWDWKSKGFGQFTVWVRDRFDDVPKHSGYDIAGLERAHAYLEKLHSEISKAMRSDIDGELDAQLVATMHDKIDEGIEKLQDRIEKVKKSKKKNKKADYEEEGLVKEAQKIFGVQNGVSIVVPLFISSLARVCVNGMVSGGHDLEDMYRKLVKKFKLTDREKMELIQLLQDMGLPMIRDRGLLPEEGLDPTSSDNMDLAANYKG